MDRLHKVLAQAGIASRRSAERLIAQGRVTVNGRIVRVQGERVDPACDSIKVDGKGVPARPATRIYLMLHKPRGYITSLSDPQGRPTVADLIRGVRQRVVPVGRLDFNSEGLLILTDDGELARDLMRPASAVPKTYSVKVRGEPDARALQRLGQGIVLDGRRARSMGARIIRRGPNAWLEITVVEGRKHVVRRLLQAVGHPAVKLRRVRYGPLSLGRLPAGGIRPLSRLEVSRLREAVAPRAAARKSRPA